MEEKKFNPNVPCPYDTATDEGNVCKAYLCINLECNCKAHRIKKDGTRLPLYELDEATRMQKIKEGIMFEADTREPLGSKEREAWLKKQDDKQIEANNTVTSYYVKPVLPRQAYKQADKQSDKPRKIIKRKV